MSELQQQNRPEYIQEPVLLDQTSGLSITVNRTLEEKISGMAKSLARVSLTSSNLMPLLKDFKTDHEKYEKQSRATETGMFESLNAMEKGLLSFDRDKMFEETANKMKEEAISQRLNDEEYEFRRMEDDSFQRQSQYRDRTSTLKIEMIEAENVCKERTLKLQRDTSSKLCLLQQSFYLNQFRLDDTRSSFKNQFKELRHSIEGEGRVLQEHSKREEAMLSELESRSGQGVEEEGKKQKLCFQQNYHALQKIFKLLSMGLNDNS